MELEEQFREEGSNLDSAKKERLDELRQEQARAGTPKALSGVYEKFKTQYNASTEAVHTKLMGVLAPTSLNSKDTKLGTLIIETWNVNGDAVIKKEYRDRLAADLRIQSDALRRRYKEMADLQKEKKEKDEDEQPSSKYTMARKQATQIIDTMRSIADFEAGLLATIPKIFASDLQKAGDNVATAKSKYENQKKQRETLEVNLAATKTKFDNMRNAVSSIDDLEQEDKDKKIAELNQMEDNAKKELESKFEAAKKKESEFKTNWNATITKHGALRRAEPAAKTAVSQIAGTLFREVLEERQRVVREYERAITYIGNIPTN